MTDEKKFDEKLNLDTASAEKIDATNDKLVEYLIENGEEVAAEQVQYIRKQTPKNENKSEKQSPVYKKLLQTNKEILKTLQKIHEDMFDEQDTRIRSVSRLQRKGLTSIPSKQTEKEKSMSGAGGFGIGGLAGLGLFPRRRGSPPMRSKPSRGARGTRPGKGPSEAPKKTSTSKADKKLDTKKAPKPSKVSKSALGKAGKNALRMARVAGPVGVAIGVGMAAYDAYEGWDNAGEALGINDEDLTTTNKAASSAGSLISGLTFGLADSKETSKGINNFFGGNDVIEKLESEGIIDHDLIGNSDVEDWEKLSKLSASDIQKVIDIDDWSDEDMKRMKAIRDMAQTKIQKKSSDKDSAETGIQRVPYKMKRPSTTISGNTSSDPNDFKTTELFRLNNVKEQDLEGLEPNVLSNLKAMAAEYYDLHGEKIQINSAYRSFEEQQELKDKYGSKAAAPGSSMHNYGLAVDMNTVNAEKAIGSGLFKKYGFVRPVPGETWHVEPEGINRKAIREMGMTDGYTKATKYAGAQVRVTHKTSDLTAANDVGKETETKDTEKPQDAETNKKPKENFIDNSSQNLTNQTVNYEKQSVPQQTPSQTTNVLNASINNQNSEVQGGDRALNMFTP